MAELLHNPLDIRLRQFVLIALMHKLIARIHKKRLILPLVLAQHNHTRGDAHPEKQVLRQLYHRIHEVILHEILPYLLLCAAPIQDTRELDYRRRSARTQPMQNMHRESQVRLALRR